MQSSMAPLFLHVCKLVCLFWIGWLLESKFSLVRLILNAGCIYQSIRMHLFSLIAHFPSTAYIRYYLAAAKTLQRHKTYHGKLEFLPATHSGHAKDGVRCWSGCKICEKSKQYCKDKGWGNNM